MSEPSPVHATQATVTHGVEHLLRYAPVHADLCCFSLETRASSGGAEEVTEIQGFAPPAEIESFLARESLRITRAPGWRLARPATLARWRRRGLLPDDGFEHHPFSALCPEGKLDRSRLPDLVRVLDEKTAYTLDGAPVPVGVFMDYLHGRLDNAHYDLGRAMGILQANPAVTFLDSRRNPIPPERGRAESIPYYIGRPAEDGNAFIRCVWAPDAAQMASICHEPKGPGTDRHRRIFDLDLLGLRAGGAALFEDYDCEVPVPALPGARTLSAGARPDAGGHGVR